jgi:shikimate kinase
MEGFIDLYKERRNLYSSVANFTINVNELKPFEIAEKIKNHESN